MGSVPSREAAELAAPSHQLSTWRAVCPREAALTGIRLSRGPQSQARSLQNGERSGSGVSKPPSPCASFQQQNRLRLEFQMAGIACPLLVLLPSPPPTALAWGFLPAGHAGGTVTSPRKQIRMESFPQKEYGRPTTFPPARTK